MARTFAFGDIHGCCDLLCQLLDEIMPTTDDTLIFLGDMIDRGNDSKGVIDTIRHYESVCRVIGIMGNHEEMMVNALRYQDELKFWLKHGGVQTLQSFGQTPDLHGILAVPSEYFGWIKTLNSYYETDDFIFSHATPFPQVTMNAQGDNGLRWRFLENDDNWHCSGKVVVCGHSAQKDGKVLRRDGLICIDTYAYGGGKLTALHIESLTAWQVASDGVVMRCAV